MGIFLFLFFLGLDLTEAKMTFVNFFQLTKLIKLINLINLIN